MKIDLKVKTCKCGNDCFTETGRCYNCIIKELLTREKVGKAYTTLLKNPEATIKFIHENKRKELA